MTSSPPSICNASLRRPALGYRTGDIPWAPGAVSHDAVSSVRPGLSVRHLVAVEPIEPALALVGLPDFETPVQWLQLLPVIDAELALLAERGLTELVRLVQSVRGCGGLSSR